MLYEFRVTKYDPDLRDAAGAYTREDWTSLQDVGRVFSGRELTMEEYVRTEGAYLSAAVAFLREADVVELRVAGLESEEGGLHDIAEGTRLGLEDVERALRYVLRDKFWCRFEGHLSYIHVGYDYYMYVGVPHPCPAAKMHARSLGLFVEPYRSPYRVK